MVTRRVVSIDLFYFVVVSVNSSPHSALPDAFFLHADDDILARTYILEVL